MYIIHICMYHINMYAAHGCIACARVFLFPLGVICAFGLWVTCCSMITIILATSGPHCGLMSASDVETSCIVATQKKNICFIHVHS